MIIEGESSGRQAPRLPAACSSNETQGLSPDLESLVATLVGHKVSEKKARELVRDKPEAVRLHLRAVPYLPEGQGKKNFAGRLVTAIENDYELPPALVDVLGKERGERESGERKAKAKDCPYCHELKGMRYVHVDGRTSVKRCTHDPAVEERFSGN